MIPANLPRTFDEQLKGTVPSGSTIPDCACEAQSAVSIRSFAEVYEIVGFVQVEQLRGSIHDEDETDTSPMIAPKTA
jgi:hypothetical protein